MERPLRGTFSNFHEDHTAFLSSLSFFINFIVAPSFFIYHLFYIEANWNELHTVENLESTKPSRFKQYKIWW